MRTNHPIQYKRNLTCRLRLFVSLAAAATLAANLHAASGTWTNLVSGNASGSWATAGNWNNSVIADGADSTADFSTLDLTATSAVTLDGARTIGNLTFGDTTPDNNWSLTTGSGGPLTLSVTSGKPTLTANGGSNNISAVLASPLASASLVKAGAGTIRLGTANLLTNINANVIGGELLLANNNALGFLNAAVGSNYVANGATLRLQAGAQVASQRVYITGAGLGGTNGALRADAGTGNQQNTRLSFALNSVANPACVLNGDATIRVDGSGFNTQAGFLFGAITNSDPAGVLTNTLTIIGTGELRVDAGAEIAVANINVLGGTLGLNGNGPKNITLNQTVNVAAGAGLGTRRNSTYNSVNSHLTLNGSWDLNYNPGATANTAGNTWFQRVASLQGSGNITNSSLAPQTLYIAGSTSNSVFGGTINPGNNGPITFRKENQFTTLTLTAANIFSGTNQVAGGIQYINNTWNPSGGIQVAAQSGATTATLAGKGSTTNLITLGSGGIVSAGDPSNGGGTLSISSISAAGVGDVILSNANLTVSGSIGSLSGYVNSLNLTNGTLTVPLSVGGASVFANTVTVDGNVTLAYTSGNPAVGQFPLISYLSIGGLAGGGTNGLTLLAPAGTVAYLSNNVANSSLDVVVTAIPALVWEGSPAGTWNVGVGNWKSGATYTEAGTGPFVLFDDTAVGTTSVTLGGVVTPKGTTVNNVAKNYTFSGAGAIAGTAGLFKQGSGSLTIANSNTFSGSVVIAEGNLALGNGGIAGSIAAASILNSGQLTLNRSDDFTVSSLLSGNGSVVKQGAGKATIGLGGDIAGAVTVNSGTLALAPGGSNVVSGDVTGAGAFGMAGAGTLVLSSFNNTYSGGTVISNGTLRIDGVLPTGNVTDHGTLALAVGGTFPNNISGSGGVSILNSASVTFSGANTYAGPTVLLNGTLDVNGAGQLPASSAVVLGSITGGATGGQLNLNGVNQTIGGLSAGGNFTPNNITFQTGNQTLVVNGNLAVGNNLANAASSLTLADAIPGSSTLTVITNGGFIQTGLNNVGANPDAVQIDLSQIGTFYADLGASGSLRMGTLGDIPASGVGVSPNNFILAANSNVISAGAFYIGAGGMQNQPKLLLGAGTNILNADNIYLGQGFAVANRDCGIIKFYDTPSVSGSVRIRGYDGSTRANLRIGDGNAGTGGVATNIVDVSGHYADLLLGSLVLGNQPNRVGAWEQYFSFDQGVLNATNVSLSAARNGSNPASSTMTIGGGVATLGPVSLTASVASGTLNLSGGATVTAQSITSPGSGQATLDVNGATLNLSLQGFGNPATAPVIVDTFNASGTVNIGVSGTGWTVGTFTLIDYSGAIGGSGFAALNLTGLPSGVTATLVNNVANSSVDLNVTAAPPVINPNPGAILSSVAGSNLSLAWPTNSGWILQTNSVSVVQTNQWFVYPGSSSVTNVNITIDPAKLNVFFRLVHP